MLSLHSGSTQAVLEVKITMTGCHDTGPMEVQHKLGNIAVIYTETQSSPIKKKVLLLSFLDYSYRGVI